MDAGAPISYEVLAPGTPVYSSDGARIGTVAHVLAAEAQDIFDGLVIGDLPAELFPGRAGHRFVDAPEVASIHEHAVTLTLDAAACRALPEPTPNPGQLSAGPADQPSRLGGKLRRAWDLLSGNY
jgi:hypothetical protein